MSSSKSLFNRALIVQSFFPELEIEGFSQCEDVVLLKEALLNLETNLENYFNCGSGGTTLRFLLARLSREEGEFVVRGTQRLFERPHKPLFESLRSLGCQILMNSDREILLRSQGWQKDRIVLGLDYSSQFLSAILLSSWNLPFDLTIETGGRSEGGSYLEMTMGLLQQMGMEIIEEENTLVVPKNQKLQKLKYHVEPDMSSLFALVAFALFNGKLILKDFPENSLQPDFYFLEILSQMGAFLARDNSGRMVFAKATNLKPIEMNIRKTPDLFPVLAVFLSRVNGSSTLSGLDALIYKESNRLENTKELLSELGFNCVIQNKKFIIQGKEKHQYPPMSLEFSPDHDHRMAMAAALAKFQGAQIEIKNPEVVNKSFPEFWEIVPL